MLHAQLLTSRKINGDALPPSLALVAIAVLHLAGCEPIPWGKPSAADRPVSPDNVLDFGTLFQRNCAGCHGREGKVGPAPPLNDPLFRAIVPLAELERVVAFGRSGTPMPAFSIANGGTLTPAQIRVLADQIKGIANKDVHRRGRGAGPIATAVEWDDPKTIDKETPSYLSASISVPSASRSERIRKTVFNRACAGCHGDRGEGGSGAGRINDPAFLALISDQALRRIIITGRPDLEMPDYASTDGREADFKPLTSEEIRDLVALLAYWRKGAIEPAQAESQADD